MPAEILTMEQGTPEWHEARLGIPTASQFKSVLAKGEGKTRKTYMLKLLDERLSGEPMESFTNVHMERGSELEDEARAVYEWNEGVKAARVGFVRNNGAGCSPDGLVGADGAVEFKTTLPHLLREYHLKDQFPAEHKAQCQGVLWLCEREWIDIDIYWPNRPPFVKRAHRDEAYIKTLADEIERFNAELEDMEARLRRKEAA